MSNKNELTIVSINVVHMPHVGLYTGIRHLTVEHARVEVSVTLSDGSVNKFAAIRTPTRGVRKEKKVNLAMRGFEPIVGMKWSDVQRIALRFQFLPIGVPWGIRYSGVARWFACFCDGNTQVEKSAWQNYQEGKEILVTCNHCTLIQKTKKGDAQ